MGMSTHVKGFRPPSEGWQKMRAVWEACAAAGVDVPDEVDRYFGGESPEPAGVEVEEPELTACGALRGWTDEYREGFEVDVTKLPTDVTILRFYNGW